MEKEKFTKQHQKAFGIISIIVFIAFTALVCWFIGRPMLKLVSEPETFRLWIDSKGVLGRLIFIGMVALQVIFAVIPGEPLEIGAGYAFGAIEGTFLCLIGGLVGALAVFSFVRKFGVRVVEIFFPVNKINNLRLLSSSKRRDALFLLFFLLPGTPKDLFLYFMGLTDIKLSHFILITTLARIPSIITSTVGGNALGIQNYVLAITVFAITVAISLVGYFIYQKLSNKK